MKMFFVLFVLVFLVSQPAWGQSHSQCADHAKLAYGTGNMWRDYGCKGWHIRITTSTNMPDLHKGHVPGKRENVNNAVSSVQIGRGMVCDFYRETGFKGAKLTLTEGNHEKLTDGWSNAISSVKCRGARTPGHVD